MSKKGSNKGIYLFWGGIAVIVIIVLLVVFLPRANPQAAYTNMENVAVALDKKDKNGHDINYFAEKFIADSQTYSDRKTNLTSYNKLWLSLTQSNDFCGNALLYVSPTDGFKALSGDQNIAANMALTQITEFQDYCTNYVTKFFDGTSFADRTFSLNETLDVFLSKYTALLTNLTEFYHTTAEIMFNHSTKSMEINPTMLQKHLDNITAVKTTLTESVVSISTVTNIYNTAQTIYVAGYYKSFV